MLSKKRIFNLIELIIQALLLISIFAIKSVEMEQTGYSSDTVVMSLFRYGKTAPNIMVYISIGLMLINIILCLVSIFENANSRDGKAHIAVPCINLFCCGWILSVNSAPSGYDTLGVNPVYKTFGFICLFAIIVLAIIKRTTLVVPKVDSQQIVNNIQETSNADELKKYKDLLDSGVITQEEFDAKKKQLLGL